MHNVSWETLADTLLWLQLGWIISGFLLMAYLAFKVFPKDVRPLRAKFGQAADSHSSSRPQLVVLGSYRFEVAQDLSSTRPKVTELRPDRLDRSSRAL